MAASSTLPSLPDNQPVTTCVHSQNCLSTPVILSEVGWSIEAADALLMGSSKFRYAATKPWTQAESVSSTICVCSKTGSSAAGW